MTAKVDSHADAEIEVRPMESSDVADVLLIERDVFLSPCDADWFRSLAERRETCRVIVVDDLVVGYVVVRVMVRGWQIISFAVRRSHQRQGLGRIMLAAVKSAWQSDRQLMRLTCEVRSEQMAACQLMRSVGIPAVGIDEDDVIEFVLEKQPRSGEARRAEAVSLVQTSN